MTMTMPKTIVQLDPNGYRIISLDRHLVWAGDWSGKHRTRAHILRLWQKDYALPSELTAEERKHAKAGKFVWRLENTDLDTTAMLHEHEEVFDGAKKFLENDKEICFFFANDKGDVLRDNTIFNTHDNGWEMVNMQHSVLVRAIWDCHLLSTEKMNIVNGSVVRVELDEHNDPKCYANTKGDEGSMVMPNTALFMLQWERKKRQANAKQASNGIVDKLLGAARNKSGDASEGGGKGEVK